MAERAPPRIESATACPSTDDPLDHLLEMLPVGVERLALDGTIVFSNAAHHRMLGYEPDELIGRKVYDLLSEPDARMELQQYLGQLAREQPKPTPFLGTNRRKDGSSFEIRVDWNYDRDAEGNLRGFVAAVTDLSAQRQAERDRDRHQKSLLESRQHLMSLMETAEEFVLYRLASLPEQPFSGEVVFVSPSICDVLGVSDPQDFPRWFENIHPDDLERVVHANRVSAETGAPFDEIMRICEKGSAVVRWVRAISRPVMGADGKPRYFNGLILDVTSQKRGEEERRRLEEQIQQRQRLESLGTLAGGIAHDFNNLLLGILGSCDLALSSVPAGTPAREDIQTAMAAARRAAELTDQLLAYSGKGVLQVRPMALNPLVEEMAAMMATAVSKKATVRFALQPDLPLVRADATQIRQVVMNLITNASDAIGEAAGEILIHTAEVQPGTNAGVQFDHREDSDQGRCVQLRVEDTGCGMQAGDIEKIFDPFFTTKMRGRGLGLAAVRGIVRLHKGGLRVQSTPGQGTTFTILLPVAERATAAEGRSGTQARDSASQSQTVLLIDDEPLVRDVASAMLTRFGHAVLTANDGRRGFALLQEHACRVDLVLLDLSMPELDGRETFQMIRDACPDLPVILTTGCHPHDVSDLLQAGGVTLLRKPYGSDALLQAIAGATS